MVMSENLSLLIPVCALALVCGGLLLVGLVLLLRMIGGSVPKWLGGLDRALGGDPRLDPSPPPSRRRSGERLRPEDLDFDAAVARHAEQGVITKPDSPDFSAQQFDEDSAPRDRPSRRMQSDQAPLDSNLPPAQGPIRKRRRKRGLSDDEVFGGMLDDDGDGDVDY
jgi:hypothetical protein